MAGVPHLAMGVHSLNKTLKFPNLYDGKSVTRKQSLRFLSGTSSFNDTV